MPYYNVPMTLEEASAMVTSYNLSGRTARAVRLFLAGVCNTQRNAAEVAGVSPAVVTRAIARMLTTTKRCHCCSSNLTVLCLRPKPVEEEDE